MVTLVVSPGSELLGTWQKKLLQIKSEGGRERERDSIFGTRFSGRALMVYLLSYAFHARQHACFS